MNALEALKKIRDYVGICGNVEETMPYELKELMVEWPANAEAGTLWENPRRHELLEELEPCKNSS